MKYLLPLLLTGCFFLSKGNSFGQQEENTRRISLKLYSQIMAEGDAKNYNLSLKFNPSVSLTNKKGHFHELELSDFSFKKEKNDFSYGTSENISKVLGLRYSFNFSLNKKGKFKAYLGAGVNTNMQWYKRKWNTPGIMDISQSGEYTVFDKGLDLNITPRLIWNVTDRWFVDVNIPVNIINFNNKIEKTDDVQQSIITNTSTTFPNKYTVNVGVGFKF